MLQSFSKLQGVSVPRAVKCASAAAKCATSGMYEVLLHALRQAGQALTDTGTLLFLPATTRCMLLSEQFLPCLGACTVVNSGLDASRTGSSSGSGNSKKSSKSGGTHPATACASGSGEKALEPGQQLLSLLQISA